MATEADLAQFCAIMCQSTEEERWVWQHGVNPHAYAGDPLGYCCDVLGVELWEKQGDILQSLRNPPYKTLVKSGHNVGKTFLAACAANWWFDSFDPGIVVTTAPTGRDVKDLLWTEIRLLRRRAGLPNYFIGPAAPEMSTSPDHYAKGYTANQGESFQGRHRERMLFIFDEAEGIDPIYYTTTGTMFKPEQCHAWLCIFNPTTTTSQTYIEESRFDEHGNPAWHVFSMSALDHPNIAAELAGQNPPIPAAVTIGQLRSWVEEMCERIGAGEKSLLDFEWPPDSGKWWRPGPVAEARILGRRPSSGTYGIWSDALWELVERIQAQIDLSKLPEIGCDVARKGDDWTEMHVRWGSVSLHHEAHNGWATDQTAGRLKQLCREWAQFATEVRGSQYPPLDPTTIAVKIDDDGVGGGVVDQRGDFAFIGVNAGSSPRRPDDYPNKRSELWFTTAEQARKGLLSITRLPQEIRHRLKQQAMAPTWKLDAAGRRVVEPKDETKKKIGRSPDSMDAMNLAYFTFDVLPIPVIPKREPRSLDPVQRMQSGGCSAADRLERRYRSGGHSRRWYG
jgi:hypothetical protein